MPLVLNPTRFNALLSNTLPGLGQNCTWERGFLCPCRSQTSGAAQQGCPVCFGKGVVWDPPVAAWTGLAGMKIMRAWAMTTEFQQGDVVVTIPSDSPLYAAGENDRVVFTDSTETFSSILMGGVDVLPFQASVIERVAWKDPTTHQLVQGGIPSQATNGSLTWGGGAPPTGLQYSISGRRHQIYWVFQELVQDRAHHAGLALPRRVALRAWDLFGR